MGLPLPKPDLLELDRCPRCDQDLAGLPARHRCPGCGFAYDESMFVLEGWRLPDRRAWQRSLIVWGPLAVLACGVMVVDYGWSAEGMLVLLGGAAIAISLLYAFAVRRGGAEGTALVHYLFSADGVAQPGKAVFLWRNYSHVILLRDGSGGWRIHMYPSWWWPWGPPIVNARMECDQSEAEAVRDLIQARINAARRAEADANRPPARRRGSGRKKMKKKLHGGPQRGRGRNPSRRRT